MLPLVFLCMVLPTKHLSEESNVDFQVNQVFLHACKEIASCIYSGVSNAPPDKNENLDFVPQQNCCGWLVIDLCSREVVGWSMGTRMKAQLVCDALKIAVWQRKPAAGLIHHSDRGSQYASKAFRRRLKIHDFKGSMSRKGDCWDNAVVESFFGSLKQERVQWRYYQTRYEARQDILNYIAVFYNRLKKRHPSNNQIKALLKPILQKVCVKT
ncbi:Mobile element protein [hydrothermal vent metagenome]|uniref:Mobile element protein n=1 Tax=hydrothermal vent metagenome TaxID=652676 RepID=A0A3B1ARQ9_9ZZZZ